MDAVCALHERVLEYMRALSWLLGGYIRFKSIFVGFEVLYYCAATRYKSLVLFMCWAVQLLMLLRPI